MMGSSPTGKITMAMGGTCHSFGLELGTLSGGCMRLEGKWFFSRVVLRLTAVSWPIRKFPSLNRIFYGWIERLSWTIADAPWAKTIKRHVDKVNAPVPAGVSHFGGCTSVAWEKSINWSRCFLLYLFFKNHAFVRKPIFFSFLFYSFNSIISSLLFHFHSSIFVLVLLASTCFENSASEYLYPFLFPHSSPATSDPKNGRISDGLHLLKNKLRVY